MPSGRSSYAARSCAAPLSVVVCADHGDTGGGAEHRSPGSNPGDGGRVAPVCQLGDLEAFEVRRRLGVLRAAGARVLHYTHTRIAEDAAGGEVACCECCEPRAYVEARVVNDTRRFGALGDGTFIDNAVANAAWAPYYAALADAARRRNPNAVLGLNLNCAHDATEACSPLCERYGHSAAQCAACESPRCSELSEAMLELADVAIVSEGYAAETDFRVAAPFDLRPHADKLSMFVYNATEETWRGLIDAARAEGYTKFWVDGQGAGNATSFLSLPPWFDDMVDYVAAMNAPAAALEPLAATARPRELCYRGSAASIQNPERGFRAELADFPAMAGLDVSAQFGLTLAQTYCYLTEFCRRPAGQPCRPLTDEFLASVASGFGRARAAGVKLVMRFAYENNSATPLDGPASYDDIMGHMRQLAPIVHAASDVVPVLAAGFVGAYGEWHSSVAHLETNHTGLALLVGAELSWFLPNRTRLHLRTPDWKLRLLRDFAPTLPAGSQEREALDWGLALANNGGEAARRASAFERIGYDQDGFAAHDTDGGTYKAPYAPYGATDEAGRRLPLNMPGNPEFDYMTREAPFVWTDGEPYAHNKGCPAGIPALQLPGCVPTPVLHEGGMASALRLRAHAYTSFSFARNCEYLTAEGKPCSPAKLALDYWRAATVNISLADAWKLPRSPAYPVESTSYLKYISDHLGYRLELITATLPPSDVEAGGALSATISIVNRGFGA